MSTRARFIIGGVINLVVISILQSYNKKIANIYIIILFLSVIMVYRTAFNTELQNLLGLLGSIE